MQILAILLEIAIQFITDLPDSTVSTEKDLADSLTWLALTLTSLIITTLAAIFINLIQRSKK